MNNDDKLPFVSRADGIPSDLTLDQYAAGELGPIERHSVESALVTSGTQPPKSGFPDGVDADALFQSIMQSPQVTQGAPSPELDRALSGLIDAEPKEQPNNGGFWAWLRQGWRPSIVVAGVAAAAVIAITVVPGDLNDPGLVNGDGGGGVRLKGAVGFTVYRLMANGKSEVMASGDRFFDGDRLRFSVTVADSGHLMILAVTPQREAAVAYPPDGEGSLPIEAGSKDPLPGAIVLDDALGEEWLHAVRCDQPFARSDLRVGATAAELQVPKGCVSAPFALQKATP